MRRIIGILTLAVVALSLTSCAATDEKTTPSSSAAATAASPAENVEQAIRQLVTERDQAVQQGDTAALDRMYATDYVATSDSGLVRTKAQVIEDLKSGTLKIASLNSAEINVRAQDDTAIVTGRSTLKGQDRGRDVSGQNRFTQVYLRRNGRWQLAALHYSRFGQ